MQYTGVHLDGMAEMVEQVSINREGMNDSTIYLRLVY